MTDPRLNHRAPRGRDGREGARWHMRVWAEWVTNQRDRGWPRESSEVRASQSKQAQTRLNKQARWRGKGAPPPMPKETRPSGCSRIPDIDRARIGPAVDRLLRDMDQTGPRRAVQAQAVRLWALAGGSSAKAAQELDVHPRTVIRRVQCGLEWLAERLRWVALERQQMERESVPRETTDPETLL